MTYSKMPTTIEALEGNDAIDINKVRESRKEKSSRARKFKAMFGIAVFSGVTAIASVLGCGDDMYKAPETPPGDAIIQPVDGGQTKKDIGHEDANTTKDAQDQDGEITRDDESDGGKPPEDTGNGDDGPKPDDVGTTDGGVTTDANNKDTGNDDIGVITDANDLDGGVTDANGNDGGPGDTGPADAGGPETVCAEEITDLQGNKVTITKEHFIAGQPAPCDNLDLKAIDEVKVRYTTVEDDGVAMLGRRGIPISVLGFEFELQNIASSTEILGTMIRNNGQTYTMTGPFSGPPKTFNFDGVLFRASSIIDAENANFIFFAGTVTTNPIMKGEFRCGNESPEKDVCAKARKYDTTSPVKITVVTTENRLVSLEKGQPVKTKIAFPFQSGNDGTAITINGPMTVTEVYNSESPLTSSGFDLKKQ